MGRLFSTEDGRRSRGGRAGPPGPAASLALLASTGWKRHLEGWPLATCALAIALLSAWLVTPRATRPDVLPLPEPSPSATESFWDEQRLLAGAARRQSLSWGIRAVGESYREYSNAVALAHSGRAELHDLRSRARAALDAGHELGLRRLRAVQGELFLNALGRWDRTQRPSRELRELSGDFAEKARRSGWLDDAYPRLDSKDFAAMFYVRWTFLAGLLDDEHLRPPEALWQAYFRALLLKPEGSKSNPAAITERQLSYVKAMSHHDPQYPRAFAEGVLLYRARRHRQAKSAFEQFLATPTNQRWRLRARNHWLECRAQLGEL